MMISRSMFALFAVLAAPAAFLPAAAQDVAWGVTVAPGSVTPTGGLTEAGPNNVPHGGRALLTVTCSTPAACTGLKVALKTGAAAPVMLSPLPPAAAGALPVYEIKGGSVAAGATATVLIVKADEEKSFTLTRTGAPPATETPAPSLANLLAVDCSKTNADDWKEWDYSGGEDWARIEITPLGNVRRRPGPVIDESDSIRVTVVGDNRILPLLKVRRTSAIRTVGSVRFIGQETDLSAVFTRQALGDSAAAARSGCGSRSWVLYDFAPGKGEVEVRALTGKAGENEMTQTVGTFDFNVNPLYSGAFSLGGMRTELASPEFGLNVDGADSTITVRSNGPYRVKYVLMYTHFIWGKRDVEKLPSNPLMRINPSIGVVLDDIPNNFVGAVTADLFEGVYFSYGAHFGRVKELDPESGLEVGDAFSGDEDDIPTLERWRVKPFFSVGVDVRAAAELLRMALTGSKSGS